MADIDFQNGFLCGMATKGLVRSGELYKPLVWNDEGVYSYFYIDFRRVLEPFSFGMFNESIIIHDTVQIPISGIEDNGSGVVKVFCTIADLPKGVTVLNKKTGRIRFKTGERVPVFSAHMFIAGQATQIEAAYIYDKAVSPFHKLMGAKHTYLIELSPTINMPFYEHGLIVNPLAGNYSTESVNLVLT